MKLDDNIKKQIQDIYDNTDDNIHSVSLGFKYKNNIKTDEISIIYRVSEKKSLTDIPKDSIIPSEIKIGEKIIKTDVIQENPCVLVACYGDVNQYKGTATDPEITRIRTPSTPYRGGMEIQKHPRGYVSSGGFVYYSQGTLGFFARDNIDGKVVGVTNSHVLIHKRLFANERYLNQTELNNPYNTIEASASVYGTFVPGSVTSTSNSGFHISSAYIKRYQPISSSVTNYIDCALIIPNSSYIDANSYRVWQPSTNNTYPTSLPFASTSEIDNLLVTNPKLYSTGRTTGPKGYDDVSSCNLVIDSVGVSTDTGNEDGTTTPPVYADLIYYKYQDGGYNPIYAGDSGSALLADIGGVRKIIGLSFAGIFMVVNGVAQSITAVACRIDRVASLMNISAFTTPHDATYPSSTSINTTSITTSNISKYGDKQSIVINGKTYYQSGLTYNASVSSIN
jgi:hypothetical protein